MNGATAKKAVAIPLSRAEKMSAITPPTLVSGLDPMAPAKNRKMSNVQIFCAPAAPALKAVSPKYVVV